MTETTDLSDTHEGVMDNGQTILAKCGLERCSKCRKVFPFEYFWKRNGPGYPDGHETVCRICGKKQMRERYDNRFIENLVDGCKRRAKKKGQPCEVTKELIMKLLEKQHGRCKYTGILMTLDHDDHLYCVSVDRKNSDLPYIESNVVLCCQAINYIKGRLTYAQMVEESRAVVMNPLSLDNPYLRKRENEGISAQRSELAKKIPMPFDGYTFEQHGYSGASVGYTPDN